MRLLCFTVVSTWCKSVRAQYTYAKNGKNVSKRQTMKGSYKYVNIATFELYPTEPDSRQPTQILPRC